MKGLDFFLKSAKVFYGLYKCGDVLTLFKCAKCKITSSLVWSLVFDLRFKIWTLLLRQGAKQKLILEITKNNIALYVGEYQTDNKPRTRLRFNMKFINKSNILRGFYGLYLSNEFQTEPPKPLYSILFDIRFTLRLL